MTYLCYIVIYIINIMIFYVMSYVSAFIHNIFIKYYLSNDGFIYILLYSNKVENIYSIILWYLINNIPIKYIDIIL